MIGAGTNTIIFVDLLEIDFRLIYGGALVDYALDRFNHSFLEDLRMLGHEADLDILDKLNQRNEQDYGKGQASIQA